MLKYLISDFAKQTLANMVKLCFNSDFPHIYSKNQIEYIFNYLKDLNCNHIILEPEYIDRDYLEDFSKYYAKSFNNGGYKSARLHFFSEKTSHKAIDKFLFDGLEDENITAWKGSYLGFIVIKPLAETFIGKTCLKPYSSFLDPQKKTYKKILTKDYHVDLFGIDLVVKSVAFQEKDTVTSVSATTSLWSAFHALKWNDVKEVTSCNEILINAVNHVIDSKNTFPQNELTTKQILRAIDIEGLKHHELKLEKMDYVLFHEVVKIHIDSGLPLIFGLEVESLENKDNESHLGFHAVTILGYKDALSEEESPCIYIHDNRLGPYVRATYSPININEKKWGLIIQKKDPSGQWKNAHEVLYPKILISLTKQKVRLSHEMALNTINLLIALFNEATKDFKTKFPVRFKLELKEISSIRKELLNYNFSSSSYSQFLYQLKEKRKDFLLKSYAKHHWVASIFVNKVHSIDILFDATAIPQGKAIAGIAYRNYEHANIFLAIFEKMATEEDYKRTISAKTKRTFLGSFLTYLKEEKSSSKNYLDDYYGELRAPVYLKPHEFHGGEIKKNGSAEIFYGRVGEGLLKWVADLEDDNPKSTTLWAICEDGSLVLGKEIEEYGHPTLTGFKPARIAGEIVKIKGIYYINSKSGRYSTDYRLTDKYLENALSKFSEIFIDAEIIKGFIPAPKKS